MLDTYITNTTCEELFSVDWEALREEINAEESEE